MNEFREMRRKLQQLTDEESMAILQNATGGCQNSADCRDILSCMSLHADGIWHFDTPSRA